MIAEHGSSLMDKKLIDDFKEIFRFKHKIIDTNNINRTGCILSSVIDCNTMDLLSFKNCCGIGYWIQLKRNKK